MITWEVDCKHRSSSAHAAGLVATMRMSAGRTCPFRCAWASSCHCRQHACQTLISMSNMQKVWNTGVFQQNETFS